MHHPVFISYARRSNREHALQLRRALEAEGGAFLDDPDLEHGQSVTEAIADALLGARVVVPFVDPEYLSSDFCMMEFDAVLAPFMKARAQGSGGSEQAVESLVIALPATGPGTPSLERLPPAVRTLHWPRAMEVEALAALVRERLRGVTQTLGERLAACGALAVVRANLLRTSAPHRLSSLRRAYLPNLELSLGQAFVGRENELWQLHHLLTSRSASRVVVEGTMGTGKTRLAIEYLYRFGVPHFRGGIFWVDAEGDEARREEQLHAILRQLEPNTPDLGVLRTSGIDVSLELARALQAVPTDEPILYVVDNVPEAEPATPEFLQRWCPSPGSVSILATSRGSPSLATSGVHALKLEVLEPGAAVALLTREVAEGAPGDSEWLRVAEWVGYLPLALTVLNRTLAVGGVRRGELMKRMEHSGPVKELERQRAGLSGVLSIPGVKEALSLSYERLPEAAQRTAWLLAQLAPEPIPLELAEALERETGSSGSRPVLLARHFITPTREADVPMLGTMHRVLADFLRDSDPEPLRSLSHVGRVLEELMRPSRCYEPREWPAMNVLRGHAEWCFQHLEATRAPVDPAHVKMMLSAGMLLTQQGLMEEALALNEKVLAWSSDGLGPHHPETTTVMHNLGRTLVDMRKDLPRARQLLQNALDTFVKVYGEVSPRAYTAMIGLAAAHTAEGQYDEARILLLCASRLYPQTDVEGWPSRLPAAIEFAEFLRQSGSLDNARILLEDLLPFCRKGAGEDHPATLTVENNLALTYNALGQRAEARALLEDCVERSRRTLGPAHGETLKAMDNLAQVLKDMGDMAAMRRVLVEMREAIRSKFGALDFKTLRFTHNLATKLAQHGEYRLALELHQENLASMLEQWSMEHPLVSLSAKERVSTLLDMRRFDEAEELRSRYLAWLLERNPSSLHPIQRDVREDMKFVVSISPSSRDRRIARRLHLGASVWAWLCGLLLAFWPEPGGLVRGLTLMGLATAMVLTAALLTRKVKPVSSPALWASWGWLCVLGAQTRLGWLFWVLSIPVALDAVLLARVTLVLRRFEKHRASIEQQRQQPRERPKQPHSTR